MLLAKKTNTERISHIVQQSIQTKTAILKDSQIINEVSKIVDAITTAFRNGNKVWFCGNGGSAADAQHLAAEFSGRFYIDRDPLPAEALHVNTSYLTAVANDYSYSEIYARIIKGSGKQGDVLIGLSTSGNSANILAAFEHAKRSGIITIGFTGETGGRMKPLSDFLLAAPSSDTPRIQEAHIMLGHIICEMVEQNIFG